MSTLLRTLDYLRCGNRTLATRTLNRASYDFDFRGLLAARSLGYDTTDALVLRIGPLADYERLHQDLVELGLKPLHSVAQHDRASQLSHWYPLLEGRTPRSRWYDALPSVEQVSAEFDWPLFVKGERQTHRHQAATSVIHGPDAFVALCDHWSDDPILHWQRMVVREHLQLRVVEELAPGGLPAAFEFRTFWWHGKLVGAGPYWGSGPRFQWTDRERTEALDLASQAAADLQLPFVVIDLAMDPQGRWWIIECNDAQESGYAGVEPLPMWQRVCAL